VEEARAAPRRGVREQFLKRLAAEIERRGALDVLRNGIKDSGCKFRLAYFRPASGLNEETRRLHAANLFAVVRQVRYSTKNEKSLDLVLFLNGIPIFTAELKNPLNGQDVEDAIRQYKTDRDPREPLLAYGRCLAHFAVDPDLVYVTTQLAGPRTRFLPFNQGKFGGAGNPPVPPTRSGYATGYLWEETWARDSVLDLVRQFIHEVEEEDEKGRKTGKRFLIFPRYQQLDCVRKLVADARAAGAGQRYLIQHSAGSGKSFTIAWLAHQLATLHDAGDRRVFDSIVVITDRRVLDRQLQTTMRQFEQTLGVVENIDTTSRQLKEALESGKTIIVTTLQKFPVIAKEIGELPGKRFALIVDEAHSSQSGESTKSLKAVLSSGSLEEAERRRRAATPEEELESTILAEMEKRGRLPNLSTFAFTATPKPKTLELFGTKRADGKFAPFHLYSMRQAIEEGFILDVLANYTTYKAYWRLLKKVEDDPRYDKKKAEYLLKSFVELHPHAIGEKVKICVEHFAAKVQGEIGGRAKAMIVTRSRLHAVRYKLAVDRVPRRARLPVQGARRLLGHRPGRRAVLHRVRHERLSGDADGEDLRAPEYRFLIVANKFQTGFDQPLLHTMYVDKKLGGVNAVQTLSRLNRTLPRRRARWCSTSPTRPTRSRRPSSPTTRRRCSRRRPTRTCSTRSRPASPPSRSTPRRTWTPSPRSTSTQGDAGPALRRARAVVERFQALSGDEQHDFRGQLTDYVRLYAFLAQVLTFADADLEKLYVFARHLRRLLPADRAELPREVQQNIDMESYRIQQTGSGKIALERRPGVLEPVSTKQGHGGRARGAGDALPHHRRAERALRPQPRPRAPRDPRPDDGEARRRRGARRGGPGQHARERAAHLRPEGRARDPGDRRLELRPLQAHHRRPRVRRGGQELPLRPVPARHRNAEELIKARRVEDAGVQVHPALEPQGGPAGRQGRDARRAQDHRRVPEHRGRRPADRRGRRRLDRRHRARPARERRQVHAAPGAGGAQRARRPGREPASIPRRRSSQGKTVCVVSCQRSPEPVFLKWKGMERCRTATSSSGAARDREAPPDSAREYIRTEADALEGAPIRPLAIERAEAIDDRLVCPRRRLVEAVVALLHPAVAGLRPGDQFLDAREGSAAGEHHGEAGRQHRARARQVARLHRTEIVLHHRRRLAVRRHRHLSSSFLALAQERSLP
jgi:type I restriction enzyme, R subunit